MITSKYSWFVLLVLLFVSVGDAAALLSDCVSEMSPQEQKQSVINTNLAGFGVITLWGVAKWDYFTNSAHSVSENWFENDTEAGGADKAGHMYTSYITSHGLSYLYENWCINKRDAALYGALSSLAILGYMEVGDSFSAYGFSNEDLIVNGLGSLFGYYTYVNPSLASKLDFRWEYKLHPNTDDFTTDYENSKYLFALKLNGFKTFRHNFLKHIELQLGYYARGFIEPLNTKERNVYFGIGINLTDLFKRHGYNKTATVLRYIQVPETYLEFSRDINE